MEPWWFNALVAHKISFYHWIKRRHQGQLEYMIKTFMAGIKKHWEKHNITSHPESVKRINWIQIACFTWWRSIGVITYIQSWSPSRQHNSSTPNMASNYVFFNWSFHVLWTMGKWQIHLMFFAYGQNFYSWPQASLILANQTYKKSTHMQLHVLGPDGSKL